MSETTESAIVAHLARTEYARFADPEVSRSTRFGVFVHHPSFPDRYDACQLLACRCAEEDVGDLLSELERLYGPTGLQYRKILGHDRATLAVLDSRLRGAGWLALREWMLVHEKPAPACEESAAVTVEEVPPGSEREREIIEAWPDLRRTDFCRSQDRRLGGALVFGRLNGSVVGTTGWFVTEDGLARFRHVYVSEGARRQGVASTMIAHIQRHPAVRRQRALVVVCDERGPVGLYERLGFVKRGLLWSFRRGG